MNVSKKSILGLLLLGTLPWAQTANADIALQGHLTQGGLSIGQVEPGTQVWLDGKPLRVAPDGHFVFGFGRDETPQHQLKVRHSDGREETQALNVAARKWDIQRIEGVQKKHVNPNPKELQRIQDDNRQIGAARSTDSTRLDFLETFIWPTRGRISGVFGSQRIFNGEPRSPHSGLDIAAPQGASVVAPASGVVTLVHSDMFFSGGTLILDHGHGVSSTFIHLSKILVKVGQEVQQGEEIAKVGATGRATGPHLHWSMNWYATRLDPGLIMESARTTSDAVDATRVPATSDKNRN